MIVVPLLEATAVTMYPVMGEAPVLIGARKLTRPVGETATLFGESGVKIGAVKATGPVAGELPLALTATNVTCSRPAQALTFPRICFGMSEAEVQPPDAGRAAACYLLARPCTEGCCLPCTLNAASHVYAPQKVVM